MVEVFTNAISDVYEKYIPNKIVKFDDKDSPWKKHELKTAIKRKHRIYAKFVRRGRKPEDWDSVKYVQNETSKMIKSAKNEYYINLGRKLSNHVTGPEPYWTLFNRLLNKKRSQTYPH